MKFERSIDSTYTAYQYTCGNYLIKYSHSKNMFAGREMARAYQYYRIIRVGEGQIATANTLKEAKKIVTELIEKGE